MVDNLPTVWERPAHTHAKHRILEAYLKAWMPIMSHQSDRIGAKTASLLFVDGFAGPGCYAGGEDGSPILAIKSVLSHSLDFPTPIAFLFVEQDPDRHTMLQVNVRKHAHAIASCPSIKEVEVRKGDCETVVNGLLDAREQEGQSIGPALFFFDQFGYADVSMDLVERIMSKRMCEVFSYLNWDHMHRFLSDRTKWPSISRTYGGDEWRGALDLELKERPALMLQKYREALRTRGRSKYVCQFAMCDDVDNLLYWLFFCTNNLRGLEEMKRAMWRVDPSGGFRFSDKDDPSQLHLFSKYTRATLAEELCARLKGETRTVAQIKEFVLSETPHYLFRKSLTLLETGGRVQVIDPPPGRRVGTFPDDEMRIHFGGN